MKRVVIAFVTTILLAVGVQAATITSGAAGAFNAPGTWVGGVAPTSADDVIVLHAVTSSVNQSVRSLTILTGGQCTVNGGSFNVSQTLDIQTGGEMSNSKNLVILGNYILNGVHSGTGYIYLYGEEISGTGIMTNNKELQLRSEDKTALIGTDLDLTSLRVSFKNTVALTNNGSLSFRLMAGSGYNKQLMVRMANCSLLDFFQDFHLMPPR